MGRGACRGFRNEVLGLCAGFGPRKEGEKSIETPKKGALSCALRNNKDSQRNGAETLVNPC